MKLQRWHWHAIKWAGWTSLLLAALVCAGVGSGLFWLAARYSRAHPLDMAPYLPRIEKYLAGQGLNVTFGHMEVFYDDAPVVRVTDVTVQGENGEPAVYVEQAAIKLANRRLFLLQAAPKIIEAKGVTLRLVRGADGVGLAGMKQQESSAAQPGLVEWLNGLQLNGMWGRMKDVKIDQVNLLLRDDVQDAEWVMENGRLVFTRYPDDGERGSLTARVRRLYGANHGVVLPMPVLVTFDHPADADNASLTARFDETDVALLADYFPPQLQDLLRARGTVEVGTTLLPGNVLGRPWVTLRLSKVTVRPPEGFSEALTFPRLTLTAAYQPSPTDILEVKDLAFMSKRGNVWRVQGTVKNVTTDPLFDVTASSEEGEMQGVFDLFPDEPRGFHKALEWLRPNIVAGKYHNLQARFAGRPSVFPHCEDACGTIEITTQVDGGKVRFLPGLDVAVVPSATFVWRGQQFSVLAPAGSTLTDQKLGAVNVTLTKMFSPEPTHVLVSGTMAGSLQGALDQLRKLEEGEDRLPKKAGGTHQTGINVDVPMEHGKEATFADSLVTVSSTVRDFSVSGMDELAGESFSGERADVSLFADKSLRIESDGKFGDNPMKVVWQENINPDLHKDMMLNVDGQVDGAWLLAKAGNPKGVSLTGVVKVAANLVKTPSGNWRFGVKADAARAQLSVASLAYDKARGDDFDAAVQGVVAKGGGMRVDSLDLQGKDLQAKGNLSYDPSKPDDTTVKLKPLRYGKTDVVVDYAAQKADVSGKRLDLSGADLFGSDDKGADAVKNLSLGLKVDTLVMKGGQLTGVDARLKAVDGRWDIERFVGNVGADKVNIRSTGLAGGKRKLMLNIDNLGAALNTMGLYEPLRGGKLWGDITYDTPDKGKGELHIEKFELKDPPLLMRLLSLISLEQLVAGTDTILFNTAVVPLRLDGNLLHLDHASFEGPSMTLGLDGTYVRDSQQMDLDGRLAPAIPLNRLVSKIPLIGTILTGSQEGVVVADFKLKGTTADPQINVRPLSVLTPGLLKDIWRGLTQ
ncbi:MAG: hypothetical protein GC129_02605 [Proteobacteria bacterium]|nr:hypothetical protein [Pseudomonadota bacterium]